MVITLGREIAGIVRGVCGDAQRNALLGPTILTVRFGSTTVHVVYLAHPGIVMRKGDGAQNPWPVRHEREHIPALKAALRPL